MKNLKLKKILKRTLFPCITFLNKIIPKNYKRVLLYIPNERFEYSLGPLKEYLLNNGYNFKYNISFGIQDFDKYGNSAFIKKFAIIRIICIFLVSKYIFYTSGQIPIKPSKRQTVIHVNHGNEDFKPMGKLANIDNGDEFYFSYMIATSDLYVPIMAKEYDCPESCIKIAGDPMADSLLKANKKQYDFNTFSKLLVWMPTFRNSELMGYHDSNLDTLIPLFSSDDYEELNSLLSTYNIKLIVKLHPIQTAPTEMQRHFSHLSIYSHDEFMKSKYDMYSLMAQSDGLIGDYSSVSMQYLLTDKPQAYVVPDIEDYSSNRGFVFENPEDYMGGHIVKTKEEFNQFIKDFAIGNDRYREKRRWVCNQIFKYKDANSCERIVKLSGMSI